ncbi:MAG: hypothetical protein M3Z04_00400 [Chloroflexota bacterium]|nr:hypothetical protein [Chloroflexota bacterium]
MVRLRDRIGFGIGFGLVGLLLVGALEALGGSVAPGPGPAQSLAGYSTAAPFDLPAAVATGLTNAGILPQATGPIYPTSTPVPSPVVQISVLAGAALHLVGHEATADGCWTLFRSPDSSPFLNDPGSSGISSIISLGQNDVWVGGFQRDSSLALHWNGATWQAVPSPNIGGGGSLSALAARASDDVWGVVNWSVEIGSSYAFNSVAERATLVHWDGHAWRILPDGETAGVSQIVARAVDDVWAVGSVGVGQGNSRRTTLLHWDGKSWQDRSSDWPNAAYGFLGGLDGAAAPTAHGLWTVGGDAHDQIVHWDGLTLATVETATTMLVPTNTITLAAVSASGPEDVWVVGSYAASGGADKGQGLILHWDGYTWTQMLDSSVSALTTVVAPSAADVWALGSRVVGDVTESTVLHWDGTAWRSVSLPKLLPQLSEFTAMSATGDTLWLAGYTYQSQQDASARNGVVARLSKGACAGAGATPAP